MIENVAKTAKELEGLTCNEFKCPLCNSAFVYNKAERYYFCNQNHKLVVRAYFLNVGSKLSNLQFRGAGFALQFIYYILPRLGVTPLLSINTSESRSNHQLNFLADIPIKEWTLEEFRAWIIFS